MENRLRTAAAGLLLAALCVSCRRSEATFGYCDLRGESGWSAGNPAVIVYDNADTLSLRQIELFLRHSRDIETSLLPLVVKTVSPDSLCWHDTVYLEVRDAGGRFNGRRRGDGYEYTQAYRSDALLSRPSKYTFVAWPCADASADGFRGVGVKLD